MYKREFDLQTVIQMVREPMYKGCKNDVQMERQAMYKFWGGQDKGQLEGCTNERGRCFCSRKAITSIF